jgi:hypothetical protein
LVRHYVFRFHDSLSVPLLFSGVVVNITVI